MDRWALQRAQSIRLVTPLPKQQKLEDGSAQAPYHYLKLDLLSDSCKAILEIHGRSVSKQAVSQHDLGRLRDFALANGITLA